MPAPNFAYDFWEDGPLLTLNPAQPHLRRPFAASAVKWKVQSAWQGGGVVVAYIDVRLVIERLNLVVGGGWMDDYAARGQGVEECALTVYGVTRRDVGKGGGFEAEKAARSDALKRAAVKFGVGVSIYSMKAVRMLATSAGEPEGERLLVKNYERGGQGKKTWTATLHKRGEEWLADRYQAWLEARGEASFGPALAHGDEAGAAGIEGADEQAASSEREEAEPGGAPQIEGERADELRAHAMVEYQAIRAMNPRQIPPAQLRTRLEQAGSESLEALAAYVDELTLVRRNMEAERAK